MHLHPKSKLTHRHSRAAFTLMEMLLVLGIIGLLVGVAVMNFGGILNSGKKKTAKGHISGIMNAVRTYEVDTMKLPTNLQILVEKGKLQKLPLDPWEKPYIYRRPGIKDKTGFDVYSSGEDGIPDNADDIGSWDL
ncbi:MAG: type II secretion system protein GspG [Verrucomicrobiaceae bacterium]|nr:type II secretion system protein GspG [Verrucomicrobiaceae bacterium]